MRSLTVFLGVMLAPSLLAQTGGSLSLDDAMTRAIQNRPEVGQMRDQLELAKARLQQAKSGMMPSLLLQGVATNGPLGAPGFGPLNNPALGSPPLGLEGMASDPLKKQYGFGLTLNQTLLDFGRTDHLSSARWSLVEAAREDNFAKVSVLLLSVEQSYFGVLMAQELEKVYAQNVKQREKTVEQAQAFVDANLKSGVDLQIALANAAEAKTALIGAKNDARFAFAQLNNSMGSTAMTEYPLSDYFVSNIGHEPTTAESAMDLAAQNRPEVRSASRQSIAAGQVVKSLQSDLMPKLDSIASLGAVHPSDLITANKNYAVGIVLSIPISTGGYTEGRITEEKQRAKSAVSQQKAVREAVRLQAARAWLDVQTAAAQADSAQSQVESANKSLELAAERYRLQLGTLVEVDESETLAVKAQVQLVKAKFALIMARSTLAWATGSAFKEFENKVFPSEKGPR